VPATVAVLVWVDRGPALDFPALQADLARSVTQELHTLSTPKADKDKPKQMSAYKLSQMQADAKAKGDKAALAKLTPKFKWVGEKLVMKDATQSLELYAIHGAVHGEDMIVAYMPKIKSIFESDAYNPGAAGAVTTGVGQLAFQKLLASELDRLKVDYTLIISGHAPGGGDRDVTKADLMKAIGKATGN